MEMRSYLGRVRGLGSSNEGVHHWWMQRLTGIALVPLSLWVVGSMINLLNADYSKMVEWVGGNFNPVLLILFIVCTFYHAQLGLRVIIEDYVHSEALKMVSLTTVKLSAILLGACSAFAVLRLTFGG